MRLKYNYDIYAFDCDGVIFDSNNLKLEAMKMALSSHHSEQLVSQCIHFFANNFGLSRYKHIEHFVKNILTLPENKEKSEYDRILVEYSSLCKELYLSADFSPGFVSFIEGLPGLKYIVSGSDEAELRDVFSKRNIDTYFQLILGSPTTKSFNLHQIKELHPELSIVMIGDAQGDLNAANHIKTDFIFYEKYSLVKEAMLSEQKTYQFPIISDWSQFYE